MTRSMTVAAITILVIAAFIGWRVHAMNSESVNHFAILADPSISYTGGCESVVGSAEDILHAPGVSARSKLIFIVLGDARTANEPRELGKFDMPVSRKVIEGRRANADRQAALIRAISSRCDSVRRTSISPIFMGVRQAIADLHSTGCRQGSHCQLWVSSDLDENVDAGIRYRLNGLRTQNHLAGPIDNSGIHVKLCGYASTAGEIVDPSGKELRRFAGRDSAREDRMQRVWRSLFTDPRDVRFDPYCPTSNSQTLAPPEVSEH